MKDIQEYKDKVEQEFDQWYGTQMAVTLTEEQMDHAKSVGVSVLQTRDGGIPGGSFVQAIVKNDLSGSQYFPSDEVQKLRIKACCILMGW